MASDYEKSVLSAGSTLITKKRLLKQHGQSYIQLDTPDAPLLAVEHYTDTAGIWQERYINITKWSLRRLLNLLGY